MQSRVEHIELHARAGRTYGTCVSGLAGGAAQWRYLTLINSVGDDLRMTLTLQAPEESLADLGSSAHRIEQVQLSQCQACVRRLEATPSAADQVSDFRDQVSVVATSMSDLQASVRRLTVAGRGGYCGDSAPCGGGYTGRARHNSQGGHDGRGAHIGVKWNGARGGSVREKGTSAIAVAMSVIWLVNVSLAQ